MVQNRAATSARRGGGGEGGRRRTREEEEEEEEEERDADWRLEDGGELEGGGGGTKPVAIPQPDSSVQEWQWLAPRCGDHVGITREILLSALSLPGVSILERHLTPADLERADAVFMTSSTRELLPVAEIESLRLPPPSSPLLPSLLQAFRHYRDHYVQAAARTTVPLLTGS